MVSVTITTVAKEAGPRRPSTSRNEGWREAHPSSVCSFFEFSCQAVKYGPPLGSEHLGTIFGKKSPRLIRPIVETIRGYIRSFLLFCLFFHRNLNLSLTFVLLHSVPPHLRTSPVTSPPFQTASVARNTQQKEPWGEDATSTSRSTCGRPRGDGGRTRLTGSETRVLRSLALAWRSWPLRKSPRTVRRVLTTDYCLHYFVLFFLFLFWVRCLLGFVFGVGF